MSIDSVVKLLIGRIAGLMGMRADASHATELALAVDSARRDWQQALQEFNYAERDLVDTAILKMNTAEKHYMTLLSQAKKEGAIAWSIKPGTNAPIKSNTHP